MLSGEHNKKVKINVDFYSPSSIGIPRISATTCGFQVSHPFSVLSPVSKSTKCFLTRVH